MDLKGTMTFTQEHREIAFFCREREGGRVVNGHHSVGNWQHQYFT